MSEESLEKRFSLVLNPEKLVLSSNIDGLPTEVTLVFRDPANLRPRDEILSDIVEGRHDVMVDSDGRYLLTRQLVDYVLKTKPS